MNKVLSALVLSFLLFSLSAHSTETVNDITGLNPIEVERVVAPKTVEEVSKLIARAKGPVSIGGGRYSQGGQTATANGLFLDMRGLSNIVAIDVERKEITVQTGITWRMIQEVIDPLNLSLRIMQSYSNFTVGGSLSVNVHGRYVGEGPLVRAVQAIKIVLADGSIQEASREKNSEIFFGAIGGYGGLGVIVEATLSLTDNHPVERSTEEMAVSDYKDFFFKNIRDSKDAVFHNADLYPPQFKEVRAITWSRTDKAVTVPERLASREKMTEKEQALLKFATKTKLGKSVRQHLYDPYQYSKDLIEWRNYEASFDVIDLEPPSREKSTYVLQEYFVPVNEFDVFAAKMRQILRKNKVNVMNISIRHAHPDPGTLLAWAPEEVFAFVLYYEQGTQEADKLKVAKWTGELITAVIEHRGRHYLPYQTHATREQFLQEYPRAAEFFELKSKLDPQSKFKNKFLEKYALTK